MRLYLVSFFIFMLGSIGVTYQLGEENGMLSLAAHGGVASISSQNGKLQTQQAHLRKIRAVDMREKLDLRPVHKRYVMSSPYGMRVHPVFRRKRMHWGVDFATPRGTPVRAAAAGVISFTNMNAKKSTFGRSVYIEHDDIYSSLYAHLSDILVEEGQLVEKGDTIGLTGNTGISTNPHLHVEYFKYGSHVNPAKFWKQKKKSDKKKAKK